MPTNDTPAITRDDAITYLRTALQDNAVEYDLKGLADDLHNQYGTWDFSTAMDDPDGVERFWGTAGFHEWRTVLSTVSDRELVDEIRRRMERPAAEPEPGEN